jgi:ketosteroid isomerase-like protein
VPAVPRSVQGGGVTETLIDDRIRIEDLFSRYMWAIDTGDVEALVGCFTETGALESPAVGRYAGRSAIREFATRFAGFRERGSQLRHVISNLVVSTSGATALARCYLVVFLTRDGSSRLLGPGRYECELRKVDGQWLFERRVVIMDHDYELEGI